MKKRILAWLGVLVITLTQIPLTGSVTAVAAEEPLPSGRERISAEEALLNYGNYLAADADDSSTTSSSSAYCNCDGCVTEPEMRKIFDDYFRSYLSRETEETRLAATMVYHVGWGPQKEELENYKVYADIMSSFHLTDWTYYQPEKIEREFNYEAHDKDTVRAFNVLARRLPMFYNIKFGENDTVPQVQTVYPRSWSLAPSIDTGAEETGSADVAGVSEKVPVSADFNDQFDTVFFIADVMVDNRSFPTNNGNIPSYQSLGQDILDEVVRLTNIERAKVGAKPLEQLSSMQSYATVRAAEAGWTVGIGSNGVDDGTSNWNHDHLRPDGTPFNSGFNDSGVKESVGEYNKVGENTAGATSNYPLTTAAQVVAAWMNSPGHKANILNADYTHMAAGGVFIPSMSFYSWSQHFIAASSSSIANAEVEEQKDSKEGEPTDENKEEGFDDDFQFDTEKPPSSAPGVVTTGPHTENRLPQDLTPMIKSAQASQVNLQSTTYEIVDKRSLIIMSIYKAMGIEFYNKPVVWSTVLGDNKTDRYRMVDTPFFKQMSTADLKWNQYEVYNARGRSYLFMDNNYLEGYLVKAINDHVITQSDLAEHFKLHISKNYFHMGDSGQFGYEPFRRSDHYLIIDRNKGLTGNINPDLLSSTWRTNPQQIGWVYMLGENGISYNPGFQAMTSELGTRLIDFVEYAYQIMYSNGFPVLTDLELRNLNAVIGPQIPQGLPEKQKLALQYLIMHGILEPDIPNGKLDAPLTNADMMVYLTRIADKDSRLEFKYSVSPMDLEMADKGYYKTDVVTNVDDAMPKNPTLKQELENVSLYDYYIENIPGITTTVAVNNPNKQTEMFFSVAPPKIARSWGTYIGLVTIDGKQYRHYKLPASVPEQYILKHSGEDFIVMNSDVYSDVPEYVMLKPGGGFYSLEKTQNTQPSASNSRATQVAFLKRDPSKEALGMWEGKPGVGEELPVDTPDIVRFASTGNKTVLSFVVSNYKSLSIAGYSFNNPSLEVTPAGSVDGLKWFHFSNGFEAAVAEISGQANKFNVFVRAPLTSEDILAQMIGFSNDSAQTSYPAYYNKAGGRLLVSEEFINKELGMRKIERAERNYITFVSTTHTSVETTLIIDMNMAVSGSVLVSFGKEPCFEYGPNGELYVDIRCFANQMEYPALFEDTGGDVHVDPTPKLRNSGKLMNAELWSDGYIKYQVEAPESGTIVLNTIPTSISSTLIYIDVSDRNPNPEVYQVLPTVKATGTVPNALRRVFGNISGLAGYNVELRQQIAGVLEYDTDTGAFLYTLPEKSDYTQKSLLEGITPFPYYKDGGSMIVSNIPLVQDPMNNDFKLADYVLRSTQISTRPKPNLTFPDISEESPSTVVMDVWTGKLDASIIPPGTDLDKLKTMLFPVGTFTALHGVGDRQMDIEDIHATSSSLQGVILVYFAGGYYQSVNKTFAKGDGTAICDFRLASVEGSLTNQQKQANKNRQEILSKMAHNRFQAPEKKNWDTISVQSGTSFLPMQIRVSLGAAATEKGSAVSVLMSDVEMKAVVVSGVEARYFSEDSMFGKLMSQFNWFFETVDAEEIWSKLTLEEADYWMQIVYYWVFRVPPRFLIASLFMLLGLSFITNTRIVEVFSQRVVDPVRVVSFGLVGREEINKRTLWLSAALGIMFLLMVQQGTLDTLYIYVFDQLMEIAWRIQNIY